ncbi:hypothetical protein GALMADRAFT_132525 [Galerina marginata CBS 339.88]|uniref:Amidohydrolase-related domain-containing protein n=1 Tax=Galerina marginata (strain CBS 339.88) TaxID=685588 RepID=A0A067TU77_GALM3|nr:hypothetical protein GALMADRAFT_132525 [Galerina marginata CBS 339.88]
MVDTRLYHSSESPPSTSTAQSWQWSQAPTFSAATSNTTINNPGSSSTTSSTPTPSTNTAPPKKKRKIYQILAGQLFDSISRTLVPDQVITVDQDAGVILDVCARGGVRWRNVRGLLRGFGRGRGHDEEQDQVDVEVTQVEMGSLVLLPGFVDVHVHLFLHPYTEASWEDQLTKESLAERTVRATVHARRTLMAGFTTVRDLGTEGAFDADISLRKCLAGKNPLIPGPRYYCSTRAIISSGSYGPRSSLYPAQEGIDGIKGAEPVDGVDACVKEVRKQIGAGADWIKIYADYPIRTRLSPVSPSQSSRSLPTFSKPELAALISTAHARGVKVAAHANTPGTIHALLDLGVDSVEHGGEMYDKRNGDRGLLRRMAGAANSEGGGGGGGGGGGTTWVPTLAAYYTSSLSGGEFAERRWERCRRTFEEAIKLRVHAPSDSGSGSSADQAPTPTEGVGEGGGGAGGGAEMDNLAVGGDTGVFAHGENALEMVLMRRLGAEWRRVLGWATYGGWKCVRGMEWDGEGGEGVVRGVERRFGVRPEAKLKEEGAEEEEEDTSPAEGELELERGTPFGAIRAGWAADLVGIEGTLDGTPEEFEDALVRGVRFVMRGGVVFKFGGVEVSNSGGM